METVIGVFASRERAEETVKELLERDVPQDAIVFLTRSESEAMYLGKTLGAFVGGFVGGGVGVTAGVVAATLFSIPGIGQVFALGVGATAALGLAGKALGPFRICHWTERWTLQNRLPTKSRRKT